MRLYCHLLGLGVLSIPIPRSQVPSPKSQSQSLDNYSIQSKLTLDCIQVLGEEFGVEGLGFDPVFEFSEWLGKKIGGKNKHLRSLTMIISSFAILEFGQNVLNIGSGFTKMDLSGITLAQIKEAVQRIEEKVDALLEAPLKNAKQFFDFAITRVIHDDNKAACSFFDKVIDEATQAFNLVKKSKNSVKGFQSFIEAARLLIFSLIAKNSYDEKKECFVPFILLNQKKRNILVVDLEQYVTQCIAFKESVKTGGFFSSGAENREKVQNLLDSILKICYPYLSEIKQWTTMGSKISDQAHDNFTITVLPSYLPIGEEDKTRLFIGVDTAKNEPVFLDIWRTKDHVLTICQGIHSYKKIYNLSDKMQFNAFKNNRKTIVFTSTGSAAQRAGSLLGQYSFNPEEGCYVQTTTEKTSQAVRHYFLFHHKSSEWYVSESKTKTALTAEWLRNLSLSEEPPLDKWEYATHSPLSVWHKDAGLKATQGPLSSLCNTLKVTLFDYAAEKYHDLQGEFVRTERWLYGRPVFENSDGRLLFQHNDHSANGNDGWAIGWEVGTHYLRGLMAYHCPSHEKSWTYWNGIQMVTANVTITCDVHSPQS